MSEVAESAHVRILLSDYAAPDASGKVNMIGAGICISGFNAEVGATAPMAVLAFVDFDPKYVGESPAVEFLLEDENGNPVAMPTLMEQEGAEPQYLRVGDSAPLSAPASPNAYVPPNAVRPRKSFVMHFNNGLPLAPGRVYKWRIKVDHFTKDEWSETLYVPLAGSGPVVG